LCTAYDPSCPFLLALFFFLTFARLRCISTIPSAGLEPKVSLPFLPLLCTALYCFVLLCTVCFERPICTALCCSLRFCDF
jgi:hypothetical protein